MSDEIKEKNIIQKSIQCLSSAKLETTYEVARDIVLDYITNLQQENDRLNNITNELEKDTIELMKSYKDVNAPRYDMCKHFIYKLKKLKENNNAKD